MVDFSSQHWDVEQLRLSSYRSRVQCGAACQQGSIESFRGEIYGVKLIKQLHVQRMYSRNCIECAPLELVNNFKGRIS